MSNSVNLMMIRLEDRMFAKLCESCKASSESSDDASGTAFSDMLNNAIGVSGFDMPAAASANAAAAVTSDSAAAAGGMSISDNMIKFIENHEGFSATGYRGVDSWNVTTGYGHVIEPGENIGVLTPESAETLLKNDLKSCEASVNKEFKGVKLTQGQFDALTSFAFGLGNNIWGSTPKLVADVKSGASADVMKTDFENCSYCGGRVVQGLVNRRNAEWKVYACGDYTYC